jgi:hypothetical protein
VRLLQAQVLVRVLVRVRVRVRVLAQAMASVSCASCSEKEKASEVEECDEYLGRRAHAHARGCHDAHVSSSDACGGRRKENENVNGVNGLGHGSHVPLNANANENALESDVESENAFFPL